MRPFRALLRGSRSLTFVTQFAVVSALLLTLAGVALAHVLGHLIEERARRDAVSTATAITDIGIAPKLDPSDFAEPLSPAEQATMRGALGAVLGGHGSGVYDRLLRVNVFGRDGTVLYSDEAHLIGRRFDNEYLRRSLDGDIVSVVDEIEPGAGEGPADTRQALEVYVPLTYGLGEPLGVAESYLPYAPVAAAIRHDKLLLYGALGLTLLVFWLVMSRMVSQASRRLRATASRNDYLARHDVLTALPNRAFLLEQLEASLTARPAGSAVAVLLIDLDRFKEINDTLGHETGDQLLQHVGGRIGEQLDQAGLAATSSVARLGGDEFAVLLRGVGTSPTAVDVAARVLDALHHPYEVGGIELAVEASIGLAWAPDHGDEAGALLRHAEVAMYAAKEHRGTYTVYDPCSDVSGIGRITLLHELRQALEEDQLVLHYQPKEELAYGTVRSVEALVRWQHPERGVIPPSEFLPLVEQTGLINALTTRVLDEAVRQLRAWHQEGRELSVSVNLSARNLLDHRLPDLVAERLAAHQVEARWLEVEVTETNAMTDPARASEILRRLAALGVSVSVDDYGTGYSSLSYLRSLPVDTLKIDRSFVTPMLVDEGNAVIVRSTIELAHNLGLKVVAEGVEDDATREALAMLGCHFAQGYYLSRPLPADQLGDLLDRRRSVPTPAG